MFKIFKENFVFMKTENLKRNWKFVKGGTNFLTWRKLTNFNRFSNLLLVFEIEIRKRNQHIRYLHIFQIILLDLPICLLYLLSLC